MIVVVCPQVGELHDQLTQIEHTTTNKCQDLEDGVEAFQSKVYMISYRVVSLLPSFITSQ